jgi:hydrogenase maturation protein HypF
VQGVGFRPFVYALAQRFELVGFVLNDDSGVTVEVEGALEALEAFQYAINAEAPPLARIECVSVEQVPVLHSSAFYIAQSRTGEAREALVTPDSSVCDDCLRELANPKDRRFQYPFINCTNCGPRFTLIQNVPYDRALTTMRAFQLCPTCQAEYDDPFDRRFHAQPNACADCGPQARLLVWHNPGSSVTDDQAFEYDSQYAFEPTTQAAVLLAKGAILAIKGLGGYHLACDALNATAVQRLRQSKYREAKPFALMVPNLDAARAFCQVSEAEAELLETRQRPIVLLTRHAGQALAPEVAPGSGTLGIMLPYTPLHHLLLQAFASLSAPGQPVALVMTSGNVSDEPIIYRDDDAWTRLKTLADGMLTHNREIYTRCDDSVLRVSAGGPQFVRRARGYVPEPLLLASETPVPLLACGGHLKNTFCLGKGRQALLSSHIGDLEHLETLYAFKQTLEHFQQIFATTPSAVAYDLHPEYLASKYALSLEVPRAIGVQHHHAHIASVMAEHGLERPLIGIAADGTGYGTDGAIWGCEIMRTDLLDFQRLAHLAYAPLPGGEMAVRQPWRMAAVYLQQAFGEAAIELDIPFVQQLNRAKWRPLSQIIAKGINCPPTSSLGRLFDAVAALLGLPQHAPAQLYEGQAAIELEQLALTDSETGQSYPFVIGNQEPAELNVAPMIRAIVDDIRLQVLPARIARRFHASIAALLALTCARVRTQTGLSAVALSGGVFQNRLLLEQLMSLLAEMDFQVFINRRVPPNDGGLSLGQFAIAAARLRSEAGRSATAQEQDTQQVEEVSHVSRHSR